MKKLVDLILIVLSIMISSACAKATPQPIAAALPDPENETINPGDKIGDFLITTGEQDEVTFQWEMDSKDGEEPNSYLLEVPLGTKVITTVGIYDSNSQYEFDKTYPV